MSATFSAFAATSSSPEFKLDLRGLGPWQRHAAAATEALTYSSAWATNAASGAKAVVKVMPVLKTKPKYLVIDLSGGTNATSYGISYLDEVPGGTWSDEYKTSKLVLRHIPAGSFIMGGRATDYPGAVNTNLHMVTITREFYMGVFEVTQRQWELVMGNRPSGFSNETCYAARPVENVCYGDIRGATDGMNWPRLKEVDTCSFMGKLRRMTGLNGLDLPTDAQWEYACRAGTSTALNNGKNVESIYALSPSVNEVARYHFNSLDQDFTSLNKAIAGGILQVTDAFGTAKVGSYQPNPWELFDMHGNVYEHCLDWQEISPSEGINPVGGTNRSFAVVRGGAWWSGGWAFTSGYRWGGQDPEKAATISGFRLCLQGGDLPDLASATTLVNESGTGSQSWTPTRSGAYYLTHSTMNGTTNVQLASAWFEVAGCALALEPQGELTNGVMIAINGADEGWTVYYTTNGLAPSKTSEPYSGPFSLPESATVRAVAYNAQGVASEEASATFTLHDALSVVGAVARQRYPWNGMVDVDVELKGDPEAKYQVEVEAKDLDGGTNLPVRTGAIALLPGTHRLTWNADADIAADGEFPRVAVTVTAAQQSAIAAYARSFAISTDGYTGTETLTNVPVLVRLSTNITGFAYSDFASPTNGADLAFFDASENELPYEIDEWHTNGESLVWVKLPTMRRDTRITCAYGRKLGMKNDELRIADRHLVWKEYAGVWHMNEDSGTAYDSTEHGLDALPSCGTNALADISQMVAYENGACGRARVNATNSVNDGTCLLVPSYDALNLGGTFTVEGWVRIKTLNGYEPILMRNFVSDAGDHTQKGWCIEVAKPESAIVFIGGTNHVKNLQFVGPISDFYDVWINYSAVYETTNVHCYANGNLLGQSSIAEVADNGLPLAFGGVVSGHGGSLNGQYDEIRLRGGSLLADRIKADYDMIANRKFCTYGDVKKVEELK